jgi:hypothetical protein
MGMLGAGDTYHTAEHSLSWIKSVTPKPRPPCTSTGQSIEPSQELVKAVAAGFSLGLVWLVYSR